MGPQTFFKKYDFQKKNQSDMVYPRVNFEKYYDNCTFKSHHFFTIVISSNIILKEDESSDTPIK